MWTRDGDAVKELASLLGTNVENAVAHLGSLWTRHVTAATGELWFISGEPPQVMVQVTSSASVSVAAADVQWDVQTPVLRPINAVAVDNQSLQTLATVVNAVAARSRRKFFWCRSCRSQNPGWYRHQGSLCSSCAETNLGVVH